MKPSDFERNNPVGIKPKNPFVVRCDVILLKHALTKAESELKIRIVTGFNLVNIEPAIGFIRDAKTALIIALQDECFSDENMFSIADMLCQAYKQAPLPEILATWERALDFIADMPIPYHVVEVEAESPIGTIAWVDNDESPLEDLVNEAIAANDFAVKSHPADECCPGCGGFSGCACEPVDPCAKCGKSGWQEMDGKMKFVMPPYPGVDEICPRCGGYAAKDGAK